MLLCGVGLIVTLGSVATKAQDYFYTSFAFASADFVLPPAPCFSQQPTMPMVYDGSAWMVYTCQDGRTIVRRFFHPVDSTHMGGEGGIVPPAVPAGPAVSCGTTKPGADWRCVNGGWVPGR